MFAACLISSAIKVANQWDRAVVLRLGKFRSLKGPGLFYIIPIIDKISYWIHIRVISTAFKAEKTLTKDTVPVDVDAVLFWKVIDPKKAALEITDYESASAGHRKQLCGTSSVKRFFQICLKGEPKSAMNCKSSLMNGLSHGVLK